MLFVVCAFGAAFFAAIGVLILTGRLSVLLHKRAIEGGKGEETRRKSNLGNGVVSVLQQLPCGVETIVIKVFLGRHARTALKHAVEITAVDGQCLGQIVDGDVVGVVQLDVGNRFLNVCVDLNFLALIGGNVARKGGGDTKKMLD